MPMNPVSENFDINIDSWDDIPDSDIIPESTYELLCTKAELVFTSTDKLAVNVWFSVGAGELEGSLLQPQLFVLGTNDDPQGLLPETRRSVFGWKNLKKLCNAMGVRYEQSLRKTVEEIPGKRVVCVIKVVQQKEGDYKGQEQNRISAYYPVGQRVPQNTLNGSGPVPQGQGQATQVQGQTPQPQRRMSAAEALASQRSEVNT